MRMIGFVFIFVFNLSLYQAKTLTYGSSRYGETNSHKTSSGDISPTFVERSRIERQSHTGNSYGRYPNPQYESNVGNEFSNNPPQRSDNFDPDIYNTQHTKPVTNNNKQFDYTDITNIGNGQNKHNVVDVNNNQNTLRGSTNTNIGNGFGNRNEVNVQENADELGHPDTVLSPDIKIETNTQQANYNPTWNPENSLTQNNNNRGLNNDQVDERRIGNSNGFFHNTDTNIGNKRNNINTDTNRNLPPGNSYGRHPNPQYESNVGNEFSNNPPQRSDNFDPDIYNTQHTKPVTNNNKQFDYTDITNIGNGQNKHNVVDVNNTQNTLRGTIITDIGSIYNTQNTRRGTTITNIGNGFGNRNIVNIQDNYGLGHPDSVLPSDVRSRTNTQQTPEGSYTRKNNNRGLNNNQVSRTYTRIGKGTDNKNIIIVNGVPVYSNSGATITTTHHQGRGKATCQMTGTCHSPVIGLPTLKRKFRKNGVRHLPHLQFSKNQHQNYKEYFEKLINPFLRLFIKN